MIVAASTTLLADSRSGGRGGFAFKQRWWRHLLRDSAWVA
jgi:hypothetical protein